VPEGVEALIGVFMPCVGEVEGEHGGFELRRPQGALDEPRSDTSFKQMGGIRMPEGRDGDALCGDTGSLFGGAEGALDAGPTSRRGRRGAWVVSAPGGGKEPRGVTMGLPGGAQQRERICGERDITVLGTLASMAMDLEALSVDVRALQGEGCMEPEAQARDRGEGDLVVERGGGRQESPDCLHTEHSGKLVCGVRAPECEGVPVTLEDVLREEAKATGADAHGRWGKTVDVFPVQEVVLQFLCREAVR
jgi:hypothetical protein